MNSHSTSHNHGIFIAKWGESLAEFDMVIDRIVIEETYYELVVVLGCIGPWTMGMSSGLSSGSNATLNGTQIP